VLNRVSKRHFAGEKTRTSCEKIWWKIQE